MEPLSIAIARITELQNTALYFERAAKAAGHKVTVLNAIDADVSIRSFDVLLVFDPLFDGFTYLPGLTCKTAVVMIDVHRDMRTRQMYARYFDHVFVAQCDYVSQFAAGGHPHVHWLPLGGDPDIHYVPNLVRDIEVGFVGKLGSPGSDRHLVLSEVLGQFRTNEVGRHYTPREMGEVYSRSKIVFNKSIGGDVNMRFFEALAAGALLVTDRTGNGLEMLATEGVHYVGYDTSSEAIEKIQQYLQDETARARIAQAGQALLLERHCYSDRLQQILDTVQFAPARAAPARKAVPRQLRLWRAEWARYNGVSPGDAASLVAEGLPFAGLGHLVVGLARAARRWLRAG